MAEKDLTEAAWKAFDKDKKYKADALVKAMKVLTTLDKGGKGLGAEKLKALKEIEGEADDLRKANKADKELAAQLKKIDDAVTRQRKETEREIREEEEAQEEEADSPVLLTKKMVPLLRELRKGDVRMNAMICTAGKATAVLIMRRAISPSRFKLLTEFVDAAGGAKKIVGECVFEAGALTFVVQSPAGGLAKRLRQALIDQTELKFKVKVRGEDGAEDDDGEDAGEDPQDAPAAATQPAPPEAPASPEALEYTQRLRKLTPRYDEARQAKHPELTKLNALMGMASERANAEPADYAGAIKALVGVEKLLDAPVPVNDGGVDPAAAFNARLAALMPKIKEALAAAGPNAAPIKLKVSEAGALARQRRFDEAQALLDELERLLEAGPGPQTEQESASTERANQAAAEIEAARGKGNVRLKRLAIEWRQSMQRARSEAERLVQSIADHPKVVYDPRADEIRARASLLLEQMPRFDGSLEAALQDLADAGDASSRQQSSAQALAAAEAYLKTLDKNPVLRDLDNTFAGKASIYSEMHGTLQGMRELLRQA